MRSFLQDVRYAIRTLSNSPGFATIAIVTLALGMAVNTAVFSIANGLLLRPLPVPHPDELVVLATQQAKVAGYDGISYPDFQDLRAQATTLSDVAAYRVTLMGLAYGGKGDHCVISRVSGNYFSLLGVQPSLGRLILPTESQNPGDDPILVLSYAYWQKHFGGDQNILGKQVEVDGSPVTIVGVAPKGFQGAYAFLGMDGFAPLSSRVGQEEGRVEELWTRRDERSLKVIARLKPGATLQSTRTELGVIAQRLAQAHPDADKEMGLAVFPEKLARPEPDPDNSIVFAMSAFSILAALVLFVACFNIANVLLVRATVRQREMAIRAAMGAGPGRLIRQNLTESLLIAFLGGAAGLILGWWASGFLSALPLGTDLPIHFDFQPDLRVYLFTAVVVLFTAIVVGIVPALRVSRTDVNVSLREGGRSASDGPRRHLLRNGLVAAQVAGSVLLLIVAGLFTRSLGKAQHLYLGLNPDHVLNLSLDVQQVAYKESQGREFYRELQNRLRVLPGVTSVSQAFSVPMGLITASESPQPEGHPLEPGQPLPTVIYNMVSPEYFDTLQIALRRGRVFSDADNEKAPHVAVINETMAAKFWPNEDALGKRFKLRDPKSPSVEVVGIVQDGKYRGVVEDPQPYFYIPLEQSYMPLRVFQIRTAVPPASLERQVAATVSKLAPGLPVTGLRTFREELAGINGYLFFQLGAQISAALGLLGLVLAVVGVYSVVSYAAAQRTHEIGIRMALGADPSSILRMVLRQSIIVISIGIVIGLAISLAVTRALGGFLVGISPTDPLTFILVVGALTLIALLACWIPARRATRVNPMIALRYD